MHIYIYIHTGNGQKQEDVSSFGLPSDLSLTSWIYPFLPMPF